jgi:hypothetical protein
VIPYTTLAELGAKEAREDKGSAIPSAKKSLTRAQKVS